MVSTVFFLQMLTANTSIKTIPTPFPLPVEERTSIWTNSVYSHTCTSVPSTPTLRCGLVTHFWPMECKQKWHLILSALVPAPLGTLPCFLHLPDRPDNLRSTLGATRYGWRSGRQPRTLKSNYRAQSCNPWCPGNTFECQITEIKFYSDEPLQDNISTLSQLSPT